MVSKNQIKLISSLHLKKNRIACQLFIAEGVKVIQELLKSNFTLEHLYCTEPLFDAVQADLKSIISESELKKISALTTPNNCLAVFKIPTSVPIVEKGLILALDDIRDPGNLGTILRLCDWFGISQVICSEQTVDLYNPKVVQATMGSISRVNVSYVNLKSYLQNSSLPIFGTFMDGSNVYKQNLPKEAIVIMGNEANGISQEIENSIKNRLTIPRLSLIHI